MNHPLPPASAGPTPALALHGDGHSEHEADEFTYGTVTGGWQLCGEHLLAGSTQVLAVMGLHNADPGNGHFKEFLRQLIDHCVKHEYDLAVWDVHNKGLYEHLLTRWGFLATDRYALLVLPCHSAGNR